MHSTLVILLQFIVIVNTVLLLPYSRVDLGTQMSGMQLKSGGVDG